MKNKMKIILSMLLVGLLFLTGCAISDDSSSGGEFERFTLMELGTMPAEDEENPTQYIVAPETDEDKVRIYRNDFGDGLSIGQKEEIHDLESVTITDEEIIIGYDGQEDRFERLSESVAMNENNIRYHFEEK